MKTKKLNSYNRRLIRANANGFVTLPILLGIIITISIAVLIVQLQHGNFKNSRLMIAISTIEKWVGDTQQHVKGAWISEKSKGNHFRWDCFIKDISHRIFPTSKKKSKIAIKSKKQKVHPRKNIINYFAMGNTE